ncbi:MAG TPA: GldG family protein [Patescibacteria group bacterium]|nr:GldG family protein [Patescibacteria group bacterium]
MKWSRINILKTFQLESVQKTTIFLAACSIFIIANLLIGYVIPIRFDFSAGKSHTLSPSTVKIIHTLDDVVTIQFFISSDIPTRLASLKNDTIDLVNEYKKQGRGKIIVKIRDPKKDTNARDDAQKVGVPELQFSQVEKNTYAVSSTYFGIALQYGIKQDSIPQATNISSLEYDITSSIFKLASKEPIKIGIIGIPEFASPQQDSFLTIKKILNQQFELDFMNASDSAKTGEIDESVKAIVIFDDGNTSYDKATSDMFTTYIKNSGKIIAFVDGISVSEEQFIPRPATHNLFSLFEEWGIKLNKNFVLSESSEMASFSNGSNIFVTPYPFWVKTSQLDKKSQEFAHMTALLFPWTASLDVLKKSGIETRSFVQSEAHSWSQTEEGGIAPQTIKPPEKNAFASFNLIVEAREKKGGTLLLIPSSHFLDERYIERSPDNVGVFLNFINNYASDGALSGIRARALSNAPLSDVSDQNKDTVKYLTIFLLPVLFGLIGAWRLMKR